MADQTVKRVFNEAQVPVNFVDKGGGTFAEELCATSPDTVLDLTLSLSTDAYAAGDLLADTQEIANAYRAAGGTLLIHSIRVLDDDDQAGAFDLLFLSTSQSLGTENSAPNVSDANAVVVLGHVPITAGDYSDLGGSQLGTVRNVGLLLKAAAASTSLFVAAISRDAKTYTAAGLKLKIGVMRN